MTDNSGKPDEPREPAKTGRRGESTRFRPGRSGNPAGRPQGSRAKALIALDRIGQDAATDVLDRLVAAAKGGDVRAAEALLARVWPPRKGRPVRVRLPDLSGGSVATAEALRVLAAETARGRLTPEEAEAVARVVAAHQQAVDLVALEARLAALEGERGEAGP